MHIVKAQVFDPALSQGEGSDLPVRLELLLDEIPALVHTDKTGDWQAEHHGRLIDVTHNGDDDFDDYEPNLVDLLPDSIMPVSVALVGGKLFTQYFMRVKNVRKILRDEVVEDQGRWVAEPNPIFAEENITEWQLRHTSNACVYCVREGMESGRPTSQVEVAPYRLASLCQGHIADHNASRAARRKSR